MAKTKIFTLEVMWMRLSESKTCPGYVGVSCVDGSCPKARLEDYEERGMNVPKSCKDCWYNFGCEDCAFDGTQYCEREDGKWKTKQCKRTLSSGRTR